MAIVMKKYVLPALALLAAMVAAGAHAAGIDLAAFFTHHADLGAGLSLLGVAGQTKSVEEISEALSKIGNQVKEAGEKALAEAKKAGDMSADTKTRVDELLVKQGETQAQLLEVQQKLARRGGSDEQGGQKSIGEQLVSSQEFKDYVEKRNSKSSFAFSAKSITSLAASAGDGVAPDRLAGVQVAPQMRMTIRDLISPGKTGSNLVQYLQESGFTNAAAPTGENTRKPQSSITYDLKQAPVVKIPHFIKASTEILADFPQLQSLVDVKLRYGLMLVEEAQLLKGSGVGNNLNGIYTQATAYAAPIVIASATRIDVLRLALLQAELAEYPSTGIVLHPSDWAAIELLKDSTGGYIFANPQSLAQPALWGRPVISTQAMTLDSFLVGAFQLGAQVFDRQLAQVTVATENEDDFVNNLVTILAEERLALAVYRPEAFVRGDITPV